MSEQDLLEGGGAPSFKYAEVGAKLSGRIVEYSQRNQTKPGGEVVLWPDGRPKREAVLTVVLSDGERRRDFVRGNKLHGLRTAYAELEDVDDVVGLDYECVRTADKPATVAGHSPSHQFTVKLSKSAASDVDPDDLG